MSENLFTFPGGPGDESGGDPFDLSVFTELSGNDPENPFLNQTSTPGEAVVPPVVPIDAAQPNEQSCKEDPKEDVPADMSEETPNSIPPASETVESQTPPASSSEGEEDESTEDAETPLMAAMILQEKQNERKAAEPIFAQLPVFSYNGTEEPIEDIEQTFEDLRLAKADDFPEFDEVQNLKWTVTYGKITKTVAVPRKTKIGQLKREIESSKDFMSALKKAADKHPKCMVKPVISMQKKGESMYKGAFLYLSDARSSQKTISFIPGRDGKVYERRKTAAGEFITPADHITLLDNISAGFCSSLPRIPYALMEQVISLFRTLLDKGRGRRPLEALVHIYWDKQEQRYFIHVPKQTVSADFVDAVLDDDTLTDSDRYIHFADLHSHNRMPAVFSRTDDRDEKATRVYMVIGCLNRYFPEITVRISNGGRFLEIAPEQVLEMPPVGQFPPEWLERIHTLDDKVWEAAA